LAATKFKAGTREELEWLLEHLSNDSTSTSTIVDFCNVMSDYFNEGWTDDTVKSVKSWELHILPKLILTLSILKELKSKWLELENIFPKDKITDQKQTALKSEINLLFKNASSVLLAYSNGPNDNTQGSFSKLSDALSTFGKRLKMNFPALLAVVSIANKVAEGSLSFFHFNQLQHHKN
jgi:hypothetical protein